MPSVNAKLMRAGQAENFSVLIPDRFNIYYLGGIILAGAVAALILLHPDKTAMIRHQLIHPENLKLQQSL